jgi:hypothetical protein
LQRLNFVLIDSAVKHRKNRRVIFVSDSHT